MKSIYKDNTYAVKFRLLLFLVMGMLIQQTKAQVSTLIDAGITTDITGDITLETNGDWLNQGSLFPGNSTLKMQGPFAQTLQQDGGSFYNIILDKSSGDVSLGGNIQVNQGTLSVIHQDLLLNGHLIIFDSTATLSETPGNTVKGPLGYMTTTRTLTTPLADNIGGFGLEIISDDDFGNTEIRRGHTPQTANSVQGILRYFDVIPGFDQDQEANLIFHYDESELNGNTESDLQLYRSPDGGINWVAVPGNLNVVNNTFESSNVNSFARFTLSSYCLETCIATVALTHTVEIYLNAAGLAFLSPDMVDAGSKGACGIDSLKVDPETFDCDDVGVQPVIFTVTDNFGCTKTSEVLINVIDAIAPVAQCRNITILIDESCTYSIEPSDINDGSSDACGVNLSIDIASFDCDDVGQHAVELTVTDPSGNFSQCIATVNVELAPPDVVCQETTLYLGELNSLTINPLDLIAGSPIEYFGFTFVVDPATLYCDDLGDHIVTLTSTNPLGEVAVCQAIVHFVGPDADCDQVADQCDVCDGGDDQQDTDDNGIPDCADWISWANLIPEWQCASNKVFVCHDGLVLCVNANSVQAHLDHGDFLGSCSAADCDDVPNINSGIVSGAHVEREEDGYISIHEQDIVFGQSNDSDQIQVENFPNPFFPETMIRYYLPERQWMSLTVFDMNGHPVVLLAKGIYEAGWHSVIFDGSTTADGIYCYRLQTQQDNLTRTMVLDSK